MEFRILGPLDVRQDGRSVSISGRRERAILSVLLLHANDVVPADRLIDDLWGERASRTARKSLQVRVSNLRRALGGGDRIVGRASGYVVRVERDELDLHRFEQLVDSAYHGTPAEAASTLREALALWQGRPLVDFQYDDFAQAALLRLEEIRLAALERRIDADLELGREADLVPELRELVREHPLRERFRAQLMLALYRSGRQSEALEAYRETREALVDGLGIEPGTELRELEQSILRQDPELAAGSVVREIRRSLLVAVRDPDRARTLADLAGRLAAHPPREVILVRASSSDAGNLASDSALVGALRDELLTRDTTARAVAFTSPDPAEDVLRLVAEQEVDLLLVDAPREPFEDLLLAALLDRAPCDVGLVTAGNHVDGHVLVPFSGADHDWSAIEIAAWIARANGVPIRLVGPTVDPTGGGRDASRLLASASLAVQRAFGIDTEPVLVPPEPDALVAVSVDSRLVVAGLSSRWRQEKLGDARRALVEQAIPPVLLVRGGLRPGGLAPSQSHTRFTWTIKPA